ncbi:cytochrome P450 [Aspergillus caelatus]|uniref:Cytochrome P450 n=1 Tax=Aspergillus caelatus TaxID=61420 RepID=A0A5N6ZNE7_9EURO|nr:cytochrome P450 [Aspergillus caelatus]KAE8358733.1 cytochrome P450 [Aspergillus caelatus]
MGIWYHSTVDPGNIKAILATQFNGFEMGLFRAHTLGALLGRGIFTSDGKQHHRALLRPQFTRSQISNLELEEVLVQHVLNRFQHGTDGSCMIPIDLAPLFFNLTLGSATEFLFGQNVESQLVGGPNATRVTDDAGNKAREGTNGRYWTSFGRAFDRANTISLKTVLIYLHFLYSPKSFAGDCKTVHQFAGYFIQQALSEEQESSGNHDSKEEAFVFLRELAKTTKDPIVLRGQLLNILLAGRDTTAGLLGWTFFLRARHPGYYSKLHKIIIETFGPYSEDALRLPPVVPENGRRATRNTKLPRGGGVVYNVNIMHRRKDIWGDDANEFRPQRWFALLQRYNKIGNLDPEAVTKHQYTLTTASVKVLVKFHEAAHA